MIEVEKRKPKVSVCVVTYNQEEYITECLQSIVDQETDFEFEVIVCDDCSTDKTRDIIKDFASKHSNIRPVLRENNVGALVNFTDSHRMADGKYICHMDGDDYWLQSKLQLQADFLDSNPECNLVWTRLMFIRENEIKYDLIADPNFFKKKYFRGDIIKYIAIGTNSSHMYRSEDKIINLPNFDVIDYYANVEKVGNGYAAFVSDEPLTAYRVGIGIATGSTNIVEIMHETMKFFRKKYPDNKSDLFSSSCLLFYSSLKRKRFKLAGKFFFLAISCFSFKGLAGFIQALREYKMLRIPQ